MVFSSFSFQSYGAINMPIYNQKTAYACEEIRHEGRLGVIDIGSNSIRLVVYDAIKRTPLPIFNEKVFCELGKGLSSTGKLNPKGVKLAESCIKRFLALVHIMDVVELQIIATAAIRDASDGAEFVENLERKYRINITVISGNKEARLGASGVFSSIYKPVGLAADLGGGSIELISLESGNNIGGQTTLPIGPLRLLDASKGDKAKMKKLIGEALEAEKWIESSTPKHFYAIGGSFRAIAHIHMRKEKYPLNIIHQYTIKNASLRKLLKEIISSTPEQIAKMPGASAKRFESIIPAAMVMEYILDLTDPIDIIFSASGIREGYLYEKLSPFLREEDPLIASASELALQNGAAAGFARKLFHWSTPLFVKENDKYRRLRFAVCILSEIAGRIHPEYRPEWAFNRIVQSILTGISHSERVTLATALYHRYQFKLKLDSDLLGLISEKDKAWAKLVGSIAGLAFQLSGGMGDNLQNTGFILDKNKITVEFIDEAKNLRSDAIDKRIENLNEAFRNFNGLVE